jgi:hypothetical protein
MTTRCQVTTATYQGLLLIFKKYFSIIPTTYIHFIDLDDRDHLISLSKAANNNCDTNVDVTVVAPCSVGDCDGMIHGDAKFGAPSDVDCCSEFITSESFDSDFDDDRSDLDPSNSDTVVELLRPTSLTENEIEKHKVILNLQQRLLRLKKRNQQLENKVKDLERTIKGLTIPEIDMIKQIKADSTEDPWSAFMLDQFKNRKRKSKNGHRWNQEVIRQCIIWQARSPGSYNFIRQSAMMNLPSEKTLRSYLGSSTMDVGITDLIKDALRAKLKELPNGNERGIKVNVAVDDRS